MNRPIYVLQICLGLDWSDQEKMALNHAVLLTSRGHQVFLCCVKDSLLDQYAGKHAITRVHQNVGMFGRGLMSMLLAMTTGQLNSLKKKIESFDINVVHCYDENLFLPMCFILQGMPKVAFLHSIFFSPRDKYISPLLVQLSKRLDMLMGPFRDYILDYSQLYNIPKKKRQNEAYVAMTYDENTFGQLKKDESNLFSVAIVINGEFANIEQFGVFFQSLQILDQYYLLPFQSLQKINVIFFFHRQPISHFLYSALMDAVSNYEFDSSRVTFEYRELQPLESYSQKIDLFIGQVDDSRGPQNFQVLPALEALVQGIPCLLPRQGLSMEMARQFTGAIETYRPNDAKDLLEHWLYFLTKRNTEDQVDASSKELIAKFLPGYHVQYLLDLYSQCLHKRENFWRRKAKNAHL